MVPIQFWRGKSFFRLNKYLHLFETYCAILPLFNPNIDLLQAVKVTKSGHHLLHDRASKGYGSFPCLTSQNSLHACLERLITMQISLWYQTRNRPMPLTSSVVWQMIARFRNFYNVKKMSKLSLKRRCVFPTGAKMYWSKQNILGLWALKMTHKTMIICPFRLESRSRAMLWSIVLNLLVLSVIFLARTGGVS